MTDVKDFLRTNVNTDPKELKVKLNRFNSPFVLNSLDAETSSHLQDEATHPIKNPKTGSISRDLNVQEYGDLILSESIVEPDLKNAELQKSWGTPADPVGLLKKMLMAGEYTELLQKAQTLSGFDDENMNELVDEAKK